MQHPKVKILFMVFKSSAAFVSTPSLYVFWAKWCPELRKPGNQGGKLRLNSKYERKILLLLGKFAIF
jgi:hypothetical protein